MDYDAADLVIHPVKWWVEWQLQQVFSRQNMARQFVAGIASFCLCFIIQKLI